MANYKKNIYQKKKSLKLSIDKRSQITIDKEFQIGLELYNLRKLSQAKKHFEFVLEMDRLHFNSLNCPPTSFS